MNLNTLKHVRHQVYQCAERSADALFELCDALSSESTARSLPELSLSPFFRRHWPSVYEALEDGQIDEQRWATVWTNALVEEHDAPVWISIDSTSIARPEAETSSDRGMIYVPNLPHATKPVSVGWQFSSVMLLPEQPSSWGGILSQRRISTAETAVSVGIEQLERVRPLLPTSARLLADRWYATGPFVQACQRLHLGALIRLKRNRKLYRAAPPHPPGKRGAPRKDGELFQGNRPETWGEPDATWQGSDWRGKPLVVQGWKRVHFRQARDVEVMVVRVLREQASGSKRDPRESWFIWVGEEELPLSEVAASYRRRFSHEHSYRFLKQDLLWTKVHVRTPEQFERWSLVVASAMNQLVLARVLGQAAYRPWERRRERVTPRQVRRVMADVLSQVGTPAQVPKPRGKSPGRQFGATVTRAARSAVVRKPKPEPKTARKSA
ncbi:MAG TPA: NF041680 family putative transposase [Ktedonobacteraceae bacterium]|nr:NF041680 family putative transposase [Ktedonobacteraceae bacterium]